MFHPVRVLNAPGLDLVHPGVSLKLSGFVCSRDLDWDCTALLHQNGGSDEVLTIISSICAATGQGGLSMRMVIGFEG